MRMSNATMLAAVAVGIFQLVNGLKQLQGDTGQPLTIAADTAKDIKVETPANAALYSVRSNSST